MCDFIVETVRSALGRIGPEGRVYIVRPEDSGFTHVVLQRLRPYNWQPLGFFYSESDAQIFADAKRAEARRKKMQEIFLNAPKDADTGAPYPP